MRAILVRLLRSGQLPALFVAIACGAVLYGFFQTPDYQVDTVLVRGVQIGDANQVALASGALGESIFTLDPDTTAQAVARLPWVARAGVSLETPDRVVVRLVERVPVAAWTDGDRTVLVDEAGQILIEADAPALPHVLDRTVDLAPGQAVAAGDVAAVVAITMQLGGDLAELSWTDETGFQATLTDGHFVVFGDANELDMKLAAYAAFTDETADDTWELLDISEPERPYYR